MVSDGLQASAISLPAPWWGYYGCSVRRPASAMRPWRCYSVRSSSFARRMEAQALPLVFSDWLSNVRCLQTD